MSWPSKRRDPPSRLSCLAALGDKALHARLETSNIIARKKLALPTGASTEWVPPKKFNSLAGIRLRLTSRSSQMVPIIELVVSIAARAQRQLADPIQTPSREAVEDRGGGLFKAQSDDPLPGPPPLRGRGSPPHSPRRRQVLRDEPANPASIGVEWEKMTTKASRMTSIASDWNLKASR